MSPHLEIDRRTFIAGAGSLFLTTLSARSENILDESKTLFSSCIKQADGKFGAIILNERAELITQIELPGRGHAVIFERNSNRAVAFARRPGNFALVFDVDGSMPTQTIIAPDGRHFYGHGVFSPEGDLLFTSENDFEEIAGKIGIYDVTNNFSRIGEFDSHGIGPHEILLMPDGKTLAIANGGIETHPEFGRAKLNLSTMQPSLVFLNIKSGDLIEKHTLPEDMSRLSIRHMAAVPNNSVIFGCQFEGTNSDTPPLVGRCDMGDGIRLWPVLPDNLLANYVGSVAVTIDGKHAAISSSKGGVFVILETHNGNAVKTYQMNGCGGLTASQQGFVASSSRGALKATGRNLFTRQFPFSFDNHLMQAQRS